MATTCRYQIRWQTGAYGSCHRTIKGAVRAFDRARRARDRDDCQGVGIIGINPDGSDRDLTVDEADEIFTCERRSRKP